MAPSASAKISRYVLVGNLLKSTRLTRFSSLTAALLLAFTLPCAGIGASPPVSEFKHWQEVQKRGYAAFELSEYGNAERLLKEAVILAREQGASDVRMAKSSGDLGRLLTIRGRFSEAEPYLEEELRIKEQTVGNTDGKLVQAMGQMARFYLTYGTLSKAYPMTRDVLLFVEGKIREEDEQRAKVNKLQKGAPLVGWAGQAAPVMVTPLLEWAITCDDLGVLYKMRGQYDLADRLFKAALDIKGTILGKRHLSLANSYENLAAVCLLRNEDSDAESYYRDALEITENILPQENPQVYSRLDKLAKCLIKEGKYGEAEQLYKRTRKMWQNEPLNVSNQPRSYFSLGCLYADEKNFGAAAQALAVALRESERTNGSWSIENVPVLKKYAYVLYYLGRRGEAAELQARANTIAPVVQEMKPVAKLEVLVLPKLESKSDLKGKGKGAAKTAKIPAGTKKNVGLSDKKVLENTVGKKAPELPNKASDATIAKDSGKASKKMPLAGVSDAKARSAAAPLKAGSASTVVEKNREAGGSNAKQASAKPEANPAKAQGEPALSTDSEKAVAPAPMRPQSATTIEEAPAPKAAEVSHKSRSLKDLQNNGAGDSSAGSEPVKTDQPAPNGEPGVVTVR